MDIGVFIPVLAAFFFIVGAGITVPVLMSQVAKHRPVRSASSADAYLVAEESRIAAKEDAFLKTNTTRREIASSSSLGGGGTGGISTQSAARPQMRSSMRLPGRKR